MVVDIPLNTAFKPKFALQVETHFAITAVHDETDISVQNTIKLAPIHINRLMYCWLDVKTSSLVA